MPIERTLGARRRARSSWRWIALALLLTTASPPAAHACTRVQIPLAAELYGAQVVLVGTVTSVEPGVAVLTVSTAIRGQVGATARVNNHQIGYGSDCHERLGEDGRFAVGDRLILFADPTPDGPLRPKGWVGEGVFIRGDDGVAWIFDLSTRFDEARVLAFARGEGRLTDAASNEAARELMAAYGPEEIVSAGPSGVASEAGPPPAAPSSRGCRSSGGDATGLLALVLLVGARRRLPVDPCRAGTSTTGPRDFTQTPRSAKGPAPTGTAEAAADDRWH